MARILVVDDNLQNAYMLEVLLKCSGHEVETAANGAEALEKARSRPPDLIVSDILMPVMDGFALCREWKADPQLKKIPFLIYTATFVERKDEELALSLGADRFIIKPQKPDFLLRNVQELLEECASSPPRLPRGPSAEDPERHKEYSEALFRKLQKKMADLENANAALRASEARYRIVADNTSTWEFWIGPDGATRYVSPSCLRITGRGPEEFMADPGLMRRVVHPDDRHRFDVHRETVDDRKVRGSFEFRIVHADGGTRWIAHECLPVFNLEGHFLGTRGSNRDVTERKGLEEQLLQAQKMEAVGLLAGGIAHDFNNILTAIIGYGNLMLRKMKPEDPQRNNLDQMKTRPIDLNSLTRNVEKLLRRIIGEDIRMEVRLKPGGVRVKADAGQIEQVLLNLATNARDAMPRGGRLTIETGIVETVEHGFGTPGRYGLLSVSDDGVGMDESVRQRMFEPFYSTKEAGRGTGLGLSIVYGIVSRHGGHIEVSSEPGRGTTLRILIPLIEADEEADVGSPGAGSWPQGTGEVVLVAEDDEMIREFTETLLNSLGYRVLTTPDGQSAVETFRRKGREIDLVLLDMMMPGKNGKETCEEIRGIRPDVKVLFASGYPEDMIESRGLAVEGVDFLRKPFPPGDLARKLREILDRKGHSAG
jgi:two-component system cell cycle sensor histidine kinase/response regulator CckA